MQVLRFLKLATSCVTVATAERDEGHELLLAYGRCQVKAQCDTNLNLSPLLEHDWHANHTLMGGAYDCLHACRSLTLREGRPHRSTPRVTDRIGTACPIRMDVHCPVLCSTWETGGIVFATTLLPETDDGVLSLLPVLPPRGTCHAAQVAASRYVCPCTMESAQ